MIQRKKRIVGFVGITLFLLAFFAAIFFLFEGYFLQPHKVQKELVQTFQEISKGTLVFDQFHVKRFPFPYAEFQNIVLQSKIEGAVHFQCRELKSRLRGIMSLLSGTRLADIEIHEGKLSLKMPDLFPLTALDVDQVDLNIVSGHKNRLLQIKFSGAIEGVPKSLAGMGTVSLMPLKTGDWKALGTKMTFQIHQFDLQTLKDRFRRRYPVAITGGILSGEVVLDKQGNSEWWELSGGLDLQNLSYAIQSHGGSEPEAILSGHVDFKVKWNPETEELVVEEMMLDSPMGKILVGGQGVWGVREIKELRVSALEIGLEEIPKYVTPLKEVIPLNLGFSGKSHLELALEGTWDYLTVNANWNLSPVLLTYGRYFSKPKDMPLTVIFDGLLKDGKILSGDFSVKLQEASMKGTLSDLDVQKGTGQFNVITNKFPLAGWEALLPPLEDYMLLGEMKLLVNLEGNLRDLEETKSMLNLTIEKGALQSRRGLGIRNIFLTLDYGSVGLKVKKASFEIERSPVEIELNGFNLSENPNVKMKMHSPRLALPTFVTTLEDLGKDWLEEEEQKRLASWANWIRARISPDELIENLTAEMEYRDKQWAVQEFQFQMYDGWGKMQAGLDLNWEPPFFWTDFEANQMDIRRVLKKIQNDSPLVDGIFFLNFQVQGEGLDLEDLQQKLHGQGRFSVTGGSITAFDLMDVMSEVYELSAMKKYSSGKTSFDDLRFDFEVKEGKIVTENLVLVSPQITVEGNGEMSFKAGVNYRLETFLVPSLSEEIFGSATRNSILDVQKRFGPISLLLSGPLEASQLKLDPILLPALKEKLAGRSSQKVLRNFLPEDALFERDANS